MTVLHYDTRPAPTPFPQARLRHKYEIVRARSESLAAPLSDADMTVQSMADASPAKWHLAHTTWFFETFILIPAHAEYRPFDESYNYLFNSYYEGVGARHARPRRGMLTRPTREEVLRYRAHVDEAMHRVLEEGDCPDGLLPLLELGLNHEEQHQELFFTDLLHLFAQNPTRPVYRPARSDDTATECAPTPDWISFEGGICAIGHEGDGFAFDCEGPRHEVLLPPYRLRSHPVTNGEWINFIEDGGYQDPLLWLSDGWTTVTERSWQAPLYWENRDGEWWSMTLCGMQPVDPAAPITHISLYEADAFASWAGARLPTEFEWEHAAQDLDIMGNFMESEHARPVAETATDATSLQSMFGNVWEWTQSAYAAYPGFRPAVGAVGEYNGKFMNGQYVLRGGSCATPQDHIRATYRNFFHPDKRWQFSGLRLAIDA